MRLRDSEIMLLTPKTVKISSLKVSKSHSRPGPLFYIVVSVYLLGYATEGDPLNANVKLLSSFLEQVIIESIENKEKIQQIHILR